MSKPKRCIEFEGNFGCTTYGNHLTSNCKGYDTGCCQYKAFYTQQDNEWIEPKQKGHLLKCCDCGLVHKMDFRIKNGKVQFRAKRWRIKCQ